MHPLLRGDRFLYYCDVILDKTQRITVESTALGVVALFGIALVLGFYNYWHVLYKQQQYRSFYMCFIYLFGQSICIARILGCVLLVSAIREVHQNTLCLDAEKHLISGE